MIDIIFSVLWPLFLLLVDTKLDNHGVIILFVTLEVLSFFRILTNVGTKEVVASLIKSRLIKNQNKSARKIKYTAITFQMTVSLAFSFIIIVLSSFISDSLLKLPQCHVLIQLIAVYYFFSSINEVICGVEKGENRAYFSNTISILRPITIYIFVIMFMNSFADRANGVSLLLKFDYSQMYKCIGIITAAILAEFLITLISLLFMIFVNLFTKKNNSQSYRNVESFKVVLPIIMGNRIFPAVKALLFKLPLWIMLIIYCRNKEKIGSDFSLIIYPIIPFIFMIEEGFVASFTNLSGELRNAYKNKEPRIVRHFFSAAITLTLAFGIFFVAVLFALRKNFSLLFLNDINQVFMKLLPYFAIILWSFTLINLLTNYLHKCDYDKYVYIIMGFGNLFNILINYLLYRSPKYNINSLILSMIISSVLMALMLLILSTFMLKVRTKYISVTASAILNACISAGLCKLFATLFTPHLPYLVTVLCSFIIAILIYLILIIYMNIINGKNVEFMPAFKFLNLIGEFLGVY